ncbi:hypothetical protein K3495_g10366 [Podosphaera aphanis]|nr:hypothetical protein K3495_g10366 [Podosphaera aphanis]
MENLLQYCSEQISLAQAYQSTYANDKRLPAPRYQKGDQVYLSLKNIKLSRPTKKLDHLRAGPWTIVSMKTPLVAKLKLQPQLKVDNNFHVSLLRPAHEGFPSQQQLQPPELDPETFGPDTYEVEVILDSRIKWKRLEYLVQWTGYNDKDWLPIKDLDGCQELISDFHKDHPEAPGSQQFAIRRKGGGVM